MQLIEVKTKEQEKEWVLFTVELYKNDPPFIRPIDQEIHDVFDKDKNRVFNYEESKVIRWLLKKDGQAIGRLAAFVNGKTFNNETQPTGGCGFFRLYR